MGNQHARTQNPKGYLGCQADKPFYYPSDTVTGTIYLRVTQPVEARQLEIRVRGKEKTKWYESTAILPDDEDDEEKNTETRILFEFSAPAFTFTHPVL